MCPMRAHEPEDPLGIPLLSFTNQAATVATMSRS
jgi:hypothetical protein